MKLNPQLAHPRGHSMWVLMRFEGSKMSGLRVSFTLACVITTTLCLPSTQTTELPSVNCR